MATYYISPSGSDTTGSGTIGSPWFSLNKAWTVVAAGDTVYMRGGTYTYTVQQYLTGKNGTSGNTIKIYAYTGESPVITRGATFDKSAGFPKGMVFMTANYVEIKQIRFTGMYTDDLQIDAGLYLFDVNNCTFERLESDNNVHGCYTEGSYTGNLWLNCDFHDNYSDYNSSNGNNSDGIALSYNSNTSATNTIRGCRAWNNGDDGIDTFENAGYVLIEKCWCWHNGYLYGTGTSAGNGVGIKLGSDFLNPGIGITRRRVQQCVCYDNRDSGLHINEADHTCEIYNCTIYANGVQGFNFHWNNRTHYFRNVVCFDTVGGWDCALPANHNSSNCSYGVSGFADQTTGWTANASLAGDFQTASNQLGNTRQSDGSLPVITFLHLLETSDLVDTGTNVGLSYAGSAPDRGAFEFGLSEGGGNTATLAWLF